MKKRLFSVLLSLLLVMSLICALTTVAYADVETITYELKPGDTVAKVCKTLGIDFVKNYDWITKTNKITNYSTLPVGLKLILPKPGTTPPLPSPTVTPTTPPTPGPDTVANYLVYHTMQSRETVYKVCNALGVSFQKYQNLITQINNITSYTKLRVGQVLLLPSKNAPASGGYYKIIAHTVVKGDTVVGLCKANGIDYGKNETLLRVLNNKNNMASIKIGETIYIPVPVNGGGGGGGGGGGEIDVSGKYAIKTGSNGTFLMQVAGRTVNTANKNDLVTIYPIPDKGYVLNGIKVTQTGGTAEVEVKDNSFRMPDYPVTISVTFKPAA